MAGVERPNTGEQPERSHAGADQPELQEPILDTSSQGTKPHRHRKEKRYASPFSLIPSVLCVILSWILLLPTRSYPLVWGLIAVAPLAPLSFALRGGRDLRLSPTSWSVGFSLFASVLAAIARDTFIVISRSASPTQLLEATLIGIIAIGISMCLLVTWIRKWPFAESLAVGIVGLLLGALCIPGLRTLTETLTIPAVNGTGLLFVSSATGNGSSLTEPIEFDAQTDPFGTSANSENLNIVNLGHQAINWVLLLAGGAQLIDVSTSGERISGSGKFAEDYYDTVFVNSSESGLPTPVYGQLFSGTIGSWSTASISGAPYGGSFASSTSSKIAVSLPSYGQGVEENADKDLAKLIDSMLGKKPTFDANCTMSVIGGILAPYEYVAQSSPEVSPKPNGILEWTGASEIQPAYIIADQGSIDDDNNIMFVFAILLGVSGAGVLGSLQSVIHEVLTHNGRKEEEEELYTEFHLLVAASSSQVAAQLVLLGRPEAIPIASKRTGRRPLSNSPLCPLAGRLYLVISFVAA